MHVSEESREEDIKIRKEQRSERFFVLLWIGPVIMYLRLRGGCCGVCMGIGMGWGPSYVAGGMSYWSRGVNGREMGVEGYFPTYIGDRIRFEIGVGVWSVCDRRVVFGGGWVRLGGGGSPARSLGSTSIVFVLA